MPRLPVLTERELDELQRTLWNRIVEGPRRSAAGSSGLTDGSGGLVGPFNAWLHSPSIGLAAANLGEAVRFHSSLDARALELAIVVVACHWRCDFELWAHRPRAIDAGVPPAVLDALVADSDPMLDDPGDALIVTATRQLLDAGRLTEETSGHAQRQLGTVGLVDLVTAVGYYSLVALHLNTFEVSTPDGSPTAWPDRCGPAPSATRVAGC